MKGTPPAGEDPRYLQEQLITYLGNKRRLLDFIGQAVNEVRRQLGGRKLRCFDAFSGSGIVSRYLKQHADALYTNDLEDYARVLNTCYLANSEAVQAAGLPELHADLLRQIEANPTPGLLAELYAPQDDACIRRGERVFYTRRNAVYLDTARQLIGQLPTEVQPFFLAPLLSEASVHTNTAGIFKGFYKDSNGVGKFGGRAANALQRIMAPIALPLPVFSRFDCELHVLQNDACAAAASLPEIDLAYLDPPYNQHPYGSNYFMLNMILRYQKPGQISAVSGIPRDWNRSAYNKRNQVQEALDALLSTLPARFVLISYNSEGFVSLPEMQALLQRHGQVQLMQTDYATFRGCRNLRSRALSVKEYLFLLRK
ncbi:MAG: DNA adenine methylase [Akkermansia sp.]|nr:DNA adenine methylase [Akkermansia sp.]